MEDQILKELQELKKLILSTAKESKKVILLDVKPVLTVAEASLYTGLSKSTLYKLATKKDIPYYKSQGGKITFFDKEELNKWMTQCRVKTNREIETEAATYMLNHNNKKNHGR